MTAAGASPAPAGLMAVGVVEIAVGDLYPDPRQPRKHFDPAALEELAASIRVSGILEPLLVARQERQDGKPGYTIVAGERRWRAAKLAKLATVPAIVKVLTPAQTAEIQLVENLQREDLSALELATGYAAYLAATKKTQAELAKALGKTEGYVSHMLDLLQLQAPGRQLLESGKLTAAHGREIVRLKGNDQARFVEGLKRQLEYRTPTTRDLKQDVDAAIERRKRELERAAERKQRKGKPAPKNDWQAQHERRMAEQNAINAQLPIVRAKHAPAIAARIRPLVKQCAQIPPALALRLAKLVGVPWQGRDLFDYVGKELGAKKSGPAGARAAIAYALWARTGGEATSEMLQLEAKRLVAAEAKWKPAAKGKPK